MSVMKVFDTGGTDLVQCSHQKFGQKRSQSMRQSPQWRWHLDEVFREDQRASSIIFGERSIMKAKFWNASSRNGEIARLRLHF